MHTHPLVGHAPDPDHPGWWTWDLPRDGGYYANVGKLLVRADGPGRALFRMFPDDSHRNLEGGVHGGALMTFIDMAMFAGGTLATGTAVMGVTLDCHVRFLAPVRPGSPIDAEVEVLRQSGRTLFVQGRVIQDGETVASYTGGLLRTAGA
ncbi:MAG: PaaI family thioesterase [Sphingomonas sp.]|nr:PaaI family thioesterase [Sphingomonas sp.]